VTEIESLDDIINLAKSGFVDWREYGFVTVRNIDDLLIFNYNTMAQYENRWNFFERVSRGLIINMKSGEIVARAFDKFFNWNEHQPQTNAKIVTITEKMDGSLGVLYRHDGKYKIATRGSFDGDQALWATEFLRQNYQLDDLEDELTLLFEIIYPDNRVVVDYGQREGLVLIAARNRFTGDYLSFPEVESLAQQFNFPLPRVYHFDDIAKLIHNAKSLDANAEGYVVEFADGQRFKFKSLRYLELHKMIVTLSFKNVRKSMQSGSIEDILNTVPDEFLDETRAWIQEIEQTIQNFTEEVRAIFEQAPEDSRRDFAVWVNKTQPKRMRRYLFAMLDGHDLTPLIYQYYEWRDDE